MVLLRFHGLLSVLAYKSAWILVSEAVPGGADLSLSTREKEEEKENRNLFTALPIYLLVDPIDPSLQRGSITFLLSGYGHLDRFLFHTVAIRANFR